MNKFHKGQFVEVQDNNGAWYKAEIVNQSSYREPCFEYAIDVVGFTSVEPVFVGEERLRDIIPVNQGEETTVGIIKSMEKWK